MNFILNCRCAQNIRSISDRYVDINMSNVMHPLARTIIRNTSRWTLTHRNRQTQIRRKTLRRIYVAAAECMQRPPKLFGNRGIYAAAIEYTQGPPHICGGRRIYLAAAAHRLRNGLRLNPKTTRSLYFKECGRLRLKIPNYL